MNLLRKLSSIPRSRLLFFLGAMLFLGFLLTSTISYLVSRQSIRSAILQNELPLSSNNIYSEIQHDLFRPILISSLMANDTFVKTWLMQGEKDESAITDYLSHIKKRYGTITAFLVSENTRKYYNSTEVLKVVREDNPADEWFFRVRKMTSDYEINVDPDMSNSNAMTIFINYRILGDNGEFLAATGVGLSVSAVKSLMQKYRERYHRDVYFYDLKGNLVLRSPAAPGTASEIPAHAGEKAMQTILEQVDRGDTAVEISVVASNGSLASYRYIPELNWVLVVEQASDGTGAILYKTFGLNFIVCLLVAALLLGIFHQTIIRYQRNLEAKNLQLERAKSARDRLFSIIGHDLRGPVGNLKSSLELLGNDSLDMETFKEIRDDLHRGVDHVLIALSNLMEWGSLQTNPLEAKPESVNLHTAAHDEIQLLALLAKEKHIHIENAIPAEASLWADPRQIKSVLRNLLSNAIKFTRTDGRISFSAKRNADQWTLAVTDDGVGMDSARSHALFHTDADSTLGTRGERGLGLGLQLCMDFVQANGGTISVESMPGKGTTFLVTLPAALGS